MSDPTIWYVVREDTRTLIDIIPKYSAQYQRNMNIRRSYAYLQGCSEGKISLIKEKRRAKTYRGIL